MSGQNQSEHDAFAEFAAAGTVDVGASNLASQATAQGVDPAGGDAQIEVKPPEKPAIAGPEGDAQAAGQDEGLDENGELAEDATKEQHDSYMKRLKRERIEARARVRELEEKAVTDELMRLRLENENLKKGGLPAVTTPVTAVEKLGPSPDPTDQAKYPLGHLDAQYVEDRMAWLVDHKEALKSDADLQRQQESQRNQPQQQEVARIQTVITDLATKGAAIYQDYKTSVVDTGIRGEWDLSQPTFEAAAEVEHGAQILYDLAHDKAEATRVSKLTPFQQAKYVDTKNAELAAKATARKIPSAGAPPSTQARGGNSSVKIDPATQDLNQFEKLWAQGDKK